MASPLLPPPLPPVEGLHPIVVHFPIALLTFAPVFLLLSMIWKSRTRELWLVYVLTLAAGTVAAFAATWTGEEGEAAAKAVPAAAAVFDRHEDLAELARNLFAAITVVAAIVAALVWVRGSKLSSAQRLGGGVIMIVIGLGPTMILANAAHEGGRLVHEFGVRAPLASAPGSAAPPAPNHGEDDD